MKMRQSELIIFYDYFLNRLAYLESYYMLINRNMRIKDYKNCDALDFLDLMQAKSELDITFKIYFELKQLLFKD